MASSVAQATRVLQAFVQGEAAGAKAWSLFAALPSGLDGDLVRAAFAKAMASRHGVASTGRRLNPEYLELFVDNASQQPTWPECIVALALPSGTPAWRAKQAGESLRKLGQLGVFSQSRSQTEARVRSFAQDSLFVEVVRQVVTAGEFEEHRDFHRYALIAVLVEDASAESIDTLLPLVDAALKHGESLDVLRRIVAARKAPKPALAPLRELLETRAAVRAGSARLGPFAAALGVEPTPKALSFTWWADGDDDLGVVVRADFDAEPWFTVQLARGGANSEFSSAGASTNVLQVPVLDDLVAFSAWFADVSQRLQARWRQQSVSRCTLRGKNKQALLRFFGGALPTR
jgi:hypothetical protein